MKIKAKVTSYTNKEIDVEFPCYIKQWDVFDQGGGYEKYIRYEADGTYVEITEHDKYTVEEYWEFERSTVKNPEQLRIDLGYHLIEHDHSSTAGEFYAAWSKFTAALDEVPR